MEIPLDLARTVAAVVDEGSLEAAARVLRITPSAVSQRVKTLERMLGRVLLVRSKPARSTEAGAAIVRLARQMALLEHDALAEVGLNDGDAEGGGSQRMTSLAIAVNADSLGTWFLPPLAAVAARHPVVFELHREDEEFTTALLESGQVLAAVTSRSTPVAGCTVTALGSMRYRAAATPEFVARWLPTGLDTGALARAPRVDFDRRDDMQASFLRSLGVAEDSPRHYVPASNEYAAAVRMGMGWGMIPESQLVEGVRQGALVELAPGSARETPLFWQQWNLRSVLLDAVAAEVLAAAPGLSRLTSGSSPSASERFSD